MSYQRESQDESDLFDTIKNLHEKLNKDYLEEEFNIHLTNYDLTPPTIQKKDSEILSKYSNMSEGELMKIIEESKTIA